MTTIDAIVFDLGGVLIDWEPRRLYRKLLASEKDVEHFLTTVCTQAWNEEQDAGRPIAQANASLISQHPEHEDLILAYYSRWKEMLGGEIAGTVDILRTLHRKQTHRLLALTNWSAETFPIARRLFPFLELFSGILVSGEVGLKKPDPRIFARLADEHDVELSRALFIDDAAHNIAAADALGMRGLKFESPQKLHADLQQLGILLAT